MKLINKIFILFLAIGVTSCAQETTFSEDVIAYLKVNGSAKQYDFAYAELLKMLEKQYPKSDSNSEGWTYLMANKEKYVGEMTELLIPIYQKNFDQDTIKKMTAFYESDAGKQLTSDPTKMTIEQKTALNKFYASDEGKLILEKQPLLAKEVSKASEGWSRNLYETAVSLLK
ncbi:DUF2059 domain-containing protein [Cellulophaga baltica]|uniref:DUF2059 domain-containing protein n=1 Tax=Cellulophaga TaxID=104264 RepID=UPI001C07A404|nr:MULTISPECIES: DUF2059 domain-containing protein [Cellulophaga]MBU2997016.1 DUF2059 domain-containing protein [Cellulophaga baltica]MDO6768414.1 DUF2059 domain-containing protein [Cellulophaga sp. 1_MG-2023]